MTQKLEELSNEDFLQALMGAFLKLQEAFKNRVLDRWDELVDAGLEWGNPFFESLGFVASDSFVKEFKKRFGKIEKIDYAF